MSEPGRWILRQWMVRGWTRNAPTIPCRIVIGEAVVEQLPDSCVSSIIAAIAPRNSKRRDTDTGCTRQLTSEETRTRPLATTPLYHSIPVHQSAMSPDRPHSPTDREPRGPPCHHPFPPPLASSPSPRSAAVNLLAQTFGMHNRRGQANSFVYHLMRPASYSA